MISIVRRQISPSCLEIEKHKQKGDYKCGNTIELLRDDFHNKCYICEQSKITNIEIDHFLPLELRSDLRCEWTNLFFSCGHCNNTKLAGYVPMLDCTNMGTPILGVIRYWVKPFDAKVEVGIEALSDNIEVRNTVSLLNDVYLGKTKQKAVEAANIRDILFDEIKLLTDLLKKYLQAPENRKTIYHQRIVRHLQPNSAFTAFKIWLVWQHERLRKDFVSAIPTELLPSPI